MGLSIYNCGNDLNMQKIEFTAGERPGCLRLALATHDKVAELGGACQNTLNGRKQDQRSMSHCAYPNYIYVYGVNHSLVV